MNETDITAAKQAEAALRRGAQEWTSAMDASEDALLHSETLLSTIFENAPLPMILVDRERRVRKINAPALTMARRLEKEVRGLRTGEALRCVHVFDDPRGCGFGPACADCVVRNTVLNTFETHQNHHSVEAPIPYESRAGVVPMWVLVSTAFMKAPDGEMRWRSVPTS